MTSNDPSIDPSLQSFGEDLSQVQMPVPGNAGEAIETTYLQDLIEAATDVAGDERVDHGCISNQTVATASGPDSASPRSKRRQHNLAEGDRDIEERYDLPSEHNKKRQKRAVGPIADVTSSGLLHQTQDSPLLSTTSAARLAEAQPAPAIFRAPTGRKSTRPAVAKEFRNLELCPETFHKLQAYAKKYMLDPAHPERKTYVGNRGQTDTAQVRHDLQRCVREFLEDGPGDEFFGLDSTGPTGEEQSGGASRSFSWPVDKDLIIQLCSPLLRRMVVNERQREYALKTRREGKTQDVGDKQAILPSVQIYLIDQTGKKKLGDRVDVSVTPDSSWDMIKQIIHQQAVMLGQNDHESSTQIQVLTANGLEIVEDSRVWQRVFQQVMEVEWLEGIIKVVVSMGGST